MKIFDKIKNKFKKKKQFKQVDKTKTPKDIATEKGEPWIQVIDTQINPESPSEGYFELDWNELFIKMLQKMDTMVKLKQILLIYGLMTYAEQLPHKK